MDAKETAQNAGGGIGFCGLLAILFIALKLTGFIGWSWLWVLSPLWIPLAFVLLCLLVFVVASILAARA